MFCVAAAAAAALWVGVRQAHALLWRLAQGLKTWTISNNGDKIDLHWHGEFWALRSHARNVRCGKIPVVFHIEQSVQSNRHPASLHRIGKGFVNIFTIHSIGFFSVVACVRI